MKPESALRAGPPAAARIHRSPLAVNSAVLLLANGIAAGLSFVLSVVIARGLGHVGLGQYSFVMAWAFSLGLVAEFGLNTLITRDVARTRGDAGRYIVASAFAKVGLAAPLMAGLWIAAPMLSADPDVAAGLRAATPLILLSALYGSFTAVFRAHERMLPILAIAASALAAQCAAAALAVARGGGLMELVGIAVLTQAGQVGAAWWNLRGHLRPAFRLDPAFTAQTIGRAVPFALAAFLGAIELRGLTIVLAYAAGDAAVGHLAIAVKLVEALRFAPNAFFGALYPRFSAGGGGDGGAAADRELTYRSSAAWLFAYGVAGAAALSALASPIIALAFGGQFAGAAAAVRWLAWALPVSLVGTVLELYLYARGQEGFVNGVTMLGLGVSLGAGAALALRWGAAGAGAAACLAEVVMLGRLLARRAQQLPDER